MTPDLLDNPTRLDDEAALGNTATILTNGGLKRVVCETAAETVEEQVEQVKFEMQELYGYDVEFEVTYTRQ